MLRVTWLLLLFSPAYRAIANDWNKFPDWAQTVLNQVDLTQIPKDAELWNLIDDLEFKLLNNGKLQVTRKFLRYVAREGGADEGSLYLVFGNEDDTKVKTLNGWHQKSNGVFDKLNKKDIVTLGNSDASTLTRGTTTLAFFPEVDQGSVVAFESVEIESSFFPLRYFTVLDSAPIRQRNIRALPGENGMMPSIRTFGFEDWQLEATKSDQGMVLNNLPPMTAERYSADHMEAYPYVLVNYEGDQARHLQSWDAMASWYLDLFRRSSGISNIGQPAKTLQEVQAIISEVTRKISYRQRYLSPGRGWVPAKGADVVRRAYGDCKDMVACMAYSAGNKNVLIYPVMANITDGFYATETSAPGPVFNHLISAVALESTLGLPAEIEIEGKRYLMVDPTSNQTAFGYLPSSLNGRQVMVSLESGAHWVKLPETAFEPTSLHIDLSGVLDPVFTLKGSMTLVEKGDAYGLRTLFRENNPMVVESYLRRVLDLPGFMDMKSVSVEDGEKGDITFIYQLRWPSFLMRDAGGLRLPDAIVSRPVRDLVRAGELRTMPIHLNGVAPTRWTLQLKSDLALLPGKTEFAWKDEFRTFSWKAIGGKVLKIEYNRDYNPALFPKPDLAKGLSYWSGYKEAFNPFALTAATLVAQ